MKFNFKFQGTVLTKKDDKYLKTRGYFKFSFSFVVTCSHFHPYSNGQINISKAGREIRTTDCKVKKTRPSTENENNNKIDG